MHHPAWWECWQYMVVQVQVQTPLRKKNKTATSGWWCRHRRCFKNKAVTWWWWCFHTRPFMGKATQQYRQWQSYWRMCSENRLCLSCLWQKWQSSLHLVRQQSSLVLPSQSCKVLQVLLPKKQHSWWSTILNRPLHERRCSLYWITVVY